MPKDTFYNLPDGKRELIEKCAITEFAELGFDKASINTIVQKAGIAKGSFYQYFTDKEDLFIHLLLSVIAQKKIEYISPVMMNPEEHDFFTLIKELFISGLKFAGENPELEKIGHWMMNNTNHQVYKTLMKKSEKTSMDIYYNMLLKAQRRGEFREGVSVEFIAHIFPALMASAMDYCLKYSKNGETPGLTSISDDIMKTVDLMMDFIKDGIGADQPERSDL